MLIGQNVSFTVQLRSFQMITLVVAELLIKNPIAIIKKSSLFFFNNIVILFFIIKKQTTIS